MFQANEAPKHTTGPHLSTWNACYRYLTSKGSSSYDPSSSAITIGSDRVMSWRLRTKSLFRSQQGRLRTGSVPGLTMKFGESEIRAPSEVQLDCRRHR